MKARAKHRPVCGLWQEDSRQGRLRFTALVVWSPWHRLVFPVQVHHHHACTLVTPADFKAQSAPQNRAACLAAVPVLTEAVFPATPWNA